MRRFRSTFVSLLVLGAVLAPEEVFAQACCAAASAVTPARLSRGERVLVGTELRVQAVVGSYGADGRYSAAPQGASETGFAESLLIAARVTQRLQLAGVVPWQETRRVTPNRAELGGGFGDLNLGARYDFVQQDEHRRWPGVALLAGISFPVGRPPELARGPLATDATGIGAFQLHAAAALEKRFGHWLVGATGLLAQRLPRLVGGTDTTLGTQFSGLINASYLFPNLAAVAAQASWSSEGDATIDGAKQRNTGRSVLNLGASGVVPLSPRVRLQTSLFFTPPASSLGRNQNAVAGATVAALFVF